MKAVIQRAADASVTVNGSETGAIGHGLVVLLGVTHEDAEQDADYLVNKLVHLRIFDDENGKMNRSLKDVSGEVLSISQFTLYADTRKGRRPSYLHAARPDHANELYQYFNQLIVRHDIHVKTGEFGEMMKVQLTNSGPVTIILDTDDK
ncbi:putative D-aminoacyl-tRNA deacylase-like protein [Lentibacillus kapialis]|uniref:D-aminoacyl-tRNA deacylase n=1 Tax=Lentibacillus kapialis TaxID=340214 RepID=A0A917UTB8_9BACI|nr:D-aminoacyl-tRNA deacylase [Lentibacillus kapialis]GGJ83931.1 putative D-aminoacyl-tRNA deacylase-like protein [Lentibacillus kapialis]